MWRYFSFWWPLAITGWIGHAVGQAQNGAVVRWQDGVAEIALFTVASSLFSLFGDLLSFMSQTVNTLGRNPLSRRVVLRFTLTLCSALTLPLLALAFLPGGDWVIGVLFKISGERLETVRLLLALLSPLAILQGLRDYGTGLLLQASRTKAVIALQIISAALTLGSLFGGLASGHRPSLVLAFSGLVTTAIHALLVLILAKRWGRELAQEKAIPVTGKSIFSFFWPTALTSLIFSLSRPIIFSFASRGADPFTTIAALRVAFDFAILFNNPLNQVRHLYLTFGSKELPQVRRFVMYLTGVSVGIFALVAFSPLGSWVMQGILGGGPGLWPRASEALMPLVPIPFFISMRNHYHGLAMLGRKTLGMAVGSLGRFSAIYVAASLLFMSGFLNHITGAACLAFGFFAEMILVMVFGRATRIDLEEKGG